MIHWNIDTQIEQFPFDEALAHVSQQRREHVMRFRQQHDRRLALAAYRLLQRMLSQHYHISQPPLFHFLSNGKPTLQRHPQICFNLSHCREAVACAVAPTPVGIDVESISNYHEELLPHTMNANERQTILRAPNPSQAFMQLWTMKESLLKMTGQGITSDMQNLLSQPPVSLADITFQTTVHSDFVCTVCAASSSFENNNKTVP